MLLAVPNFSEGRDLDLVEALTEAFAAGADLLVLGRTVTHADDPVAAAAALVDNALG